MAGEGAGGEAEDGPPPPRLDETVVAGLVADLGAEQAGEVCDVFVEDGHQVVVALRAACEAGDAGAAARSAHRLKSASGFVGARRVSALCGEIERLGRQDRLDEARPRVQLVAEELERVTEELRAAVPGPGRPATRRPPAGAP